MIRKAQKGLCLWALGALGAFGAGACGGELALNSQTSGGAQAVSIPAPLAQLLEASVTAPWTTRFSGVRRVEARVPGADGALELLAYREQVFADGAGRFALEPLELISFVPDPAVFTALQEAREGLLYRYRDFAIRDLQAFYASYQVVDQGADLVVAGQTCRDLEIRRLDGSGSVYRAALDASTGLVLRCVESGADGQQLGLMEFESYTADPDLGAVAWFTPVLPETTLPGGPHLASQVDFQVLQPSLLPQGYQPWKAATVVDDKGHLWLKQSFTDGVEPLFFFHRDTPSVTVVTPPPGASGPGSPAVSGGAASPPPDELWVYPVGRLTAVEGVLHEREVIALGKVDGEALLDLLEFTHD